MNINYLFLERTDSTNSHLRRMLGDGYRSDGLTVAVADDQYAGRGQQGNSWESEPGQNLSFSYLFHPTMVAPAKQFILSQAMAVAIVRELNRTGADEGKTFTVKWPNDIYHQDRKVGGTLIECDLQGKTISNCIIGTGLNVNQQTFHSDAPNPVSLCQIFGRKFQRKPLLNAITAQFVSIYEELASESWSALRDEYESLLYRREGFHPYADPSGPFMARIASIEESGHLILEDSSSQTRRYAFKEVRTIQ